jgi:hypothetical protein
MYCPFCSWPVPKQGICRASRHAIKCTDCKLCYYLDNNNTTKIAPMNITFMGMQKIDTNDLDFYLRTKYFDERKSAKKGLFVSNLLREKSVVLFSNLDQRVSTMEKKNLKKFSKVTNRKLRVLNDLINEYQIKFDFRKDYLEQIRKLCTEWKEVELIEFIQCYLKSLEMIKSPIRKAKSYTTVFSRTGSIENVRTMGLGASSVECVRTVTELKFKKFSSLESVLINL